MELLRDADGFSCERACQLANVSHETFWRLQAYADILDKWRVRVNLIGPSERSRLWRRHVHDSLRLLPYIEEGKAISLLDMGSGAGFPGLILACALADRAQCSVTLVESRLHRAAFLRAAVRACDLSACVCETRLEQAEFPDFFDYVTARALAPLPDLLALSARFVSLDSVALFLKGRNVSTEIERAAQSWFFNSDIRKYSDGGVILKLTRMSSRRFPCPPAGRKDG